MHSWVTLVHFLSNRLLSDCFMIVLCFLRILHMYKQIIVQWYCAMVYVSARKLLHNYLYQYVVFCVLVYTSANVKVMHIAYLKVTVISVSRRMTELIVFLLWHCGSVKVKGKGHAD